MWINECDVGLQLLRGNLPGPNLSKGKETTPIMFLVGTPKDGPIYQNVRNSWGDQDIQMGGGKHKSGTQRNLGGRNGCVELCNFFRE